ncbi:hypothetical protein [Nitratiruptor sp. YY09-18]|uniref:hypothetical protein n=1 Tax=Nitratiruptor sp. YY09-18 TaxID=2724901 RepID=UPI0019163D24|nr:hypothetical protein [Nitratiruptor sp. YY09-18]BCD68513.1 hypothetical protein NitYY0918_C1430 [Nitratiruptor sp. YY09-18]
MKKFLLLLLAIIVVVLGGGYWLIFTKSGNGILKPYIEKELNKRLPVKATLTDFQIVPMHVTLKLGKSSIIKAQGEFDPFARSMNIHYIIDVKNLADIEPITGQKLRGSLYTIGDVAGNKEKLLVNGTAKVVGSATTYNLTLKDFEPKLLKANVAHADLAKILYMLYQPHIADAKIDTKIVIDNFEKLHGKIDSTITQGKTDPKVLKEQFGLENVAITFKAMQHSNLANNRIKSKARVTTNVANIATNSALFNIKTGTLEAPYTLYVPDLGKLYFLTHQKMRGKITITGKIKKDKNLYVAAHSKTLGGDVHIKLLNNKLTANIAKIQTVALTHMLYYPKIFDSRVDAQLDYNILTQQGSLHAQAHDGHILPNKMSFLLSQMANFDITREVYKLTTIDSTINKKRILSDLDMESRLTHISAKRALVDLDKKIVDAKLRIEIQKRPVFVKIHGNIQNPKISLDAKELIKGRVKKELNKRLGDKVKSKIPAGAKGLLNNLF